MLSATVSHHFSAGHRILGLVGPGAKCANVHGHTFGVEWTVQLPGLDAASVEFASLKSLFRGYVDKHLDHGFLLAHDDQEMAAALIAMRSKHLVMPCRPTTEAIATMIAEECQRLCPDIAVLSVKVTEGPHNAATWHQQNWPRVEHEPIERTPNMIGDPFPPPFHTSLGGGGL